MVSITSSLVRSARPPVDVNGLVQNGWTHIELPRELRWALPRLEAAGRQFFAGTEQSKLAFDIRASTAHRGYVPTDEQGSYGDETARRYEAFDIGREAQPDDRITHRLWGRNAFPPIDGFACAARSAFDAYERTATVVAKAISAELGVPYPAIGRLRTEPVSQLRLINYLDQPQPNAGADQGAAMGAHTDYEFFTLLYQNEPGLEILNADGTWVSAPSGPRLIVLAGDLLEVLSGGIITSVLHRVRGDVPAGRMSLPFFCGADFTAQVSSIVGSAQPTLTFGDHLMRQLRRDFPYLRAADSSDDGGVINLVARGPSTNQPYSSFEHRRLAGVPRVV